MYNVVLKCAMPSLIRQEHSLLTLTDNHYLESFHYIIADTNFLMISLACFDGTEP